MNEISVIVKQEPGTISWNFEEIKSRLETELDNYQNTVYTDDTIKTAKGDVAELRKLATAIEDRRKEVKEKCLQPYAVIEAQAKELVSLIDKPIQAINDQVKDYEKRRKEKVRAEITAYWLQKSVALPEDIREKAKAQIYDSRWENATATKKSWKEGIDNGIQKILDEIATIQSFESEFEEDVLAVYKVDLSLQKAIRKMNELKAQKERILEMERHKKEQELLNQKAAETAAPVLPSNPQLGGRDGAAVPHVQGNPEMGQPEFGSNTGNTGFFVSHPGRGHGVGQTENQNIQKSAPVETRAYPGGTMRQIRIVGTEQQIKKILDYIRFTGATYEEV